MYTMVPIYEEAPTRIRPAITSKTARLSLKVLAVSGFSLPVRHPKMEGYIVYLQEGLGEITQSAVDEQLSKIKKKIVALMIIYNNKSYENNKNVLSF